MCFLCECRKLQADAHITASVGIATGRVFAGIIGSRERHEYTVIGNIVNKAARLMASAGVNDVLIDAQTKEDVLVQVQNFSFDAVKHLHLKGFHDPITAFRPHPIHDDLRNSVSSQQQPLNFNNMLFGREEDIEAGIGILHSLHKQQGGVMYIRADVAMGTTPVAIKITEGALTHMPLCLKAKSESVCW